MKIVHLDGASKWLTVEKMGQSLHGKELLCLFFESRLHMYMFWAGEVEVIWKEKILATQKTKKLKKLVR